LKKKVVEQVREYVAHKLWELVVLKSDLLANLKALKQYFLLAKGEFYQQFLVDASSLMALPPTETSERDINQGPFINAASRLGMEENPFFKKCKLRLRSFKFRYENFATIPGLSLIGSCMLFHGMVVMKSNMKHTGALWHTFKQQVGTGFKMGFNIKVAISLPSSHTNDRASIGSVLHSPK